jgi:hypothetical protein
LLLSSASCGSGKYFWQVNTYGTPDGDPAFQKWARETTQQLSREFGVSEDG